MALIHQVISNCSHFLYTWENTLVSLISLVLDIMTTMANREPTKDWRLRMRIVKCVMADSAVKKDKTILSKSPNLEEEYGI